MQLTLDVPEELYGRLQAAAAAAGQADSLPEYAVRLLDKSLSVPSSRSLLRRGTAKIHITTPIMGLVEGLLFGDTTVGEALEKGDFGLGTLNGLDGEVVILEGKAYQQSADGASVVIPPTARTPFMCTTTFSRDKAKQLELPMELDWAGLQQAIQEEFVSANVFYAILVQGSFSYIKARAVRKQAEPRPLAAVAREQAVFEFEDEEGCLVGFWSPAYMGSALTVPGFHMHFLSADKQRGGHVLGLRLRHGTAYVQPVYHTDMDLPKSLDFLRADLSKDPEADLAAAEK